MIKMIFNKIFKINLIRFLVQIWDFKVKIKVYYILEENYEIE